MDDETPETDTCHTVVVDGETILIRGQEAPDELEFVAEIVRAAKRRYAQEHPLAVIEVRDPCPRCEDRPLIPRALMAEHAARVHPETLER